MCLDELQIRSLNLTSTLKRNFEKIEKKILTCGRERLRISYRSRDIQKEI